MGDGREHSVSSLQTGNPCGRDNRSDDRPLAKDDQGQRAIRTQYHHMIDVTPTVLELLGIQQPRVVNGVDQRPMDGTSMAYTFSDAKAPSRRELQYFEMLGHRAIYYKGW